MFFNMCGVTVIVGCVYMCVCVYTCIYIYTHNYMHHIIKRDQTRKNTLTLLLPPTSSNAFSPASETARLSA